MLKSLISLSLAVLEVVLNLLAKYITVLFEMLWLTLTSYSFAVYFEFLKMLFFPTYKVH